MIRWNSYAFYSVSLAQLGNKNLVASTLNLYPNLLLAIILFLIHDGTYQTTQIKEAQASNLNPWP